MLWSRDGRFRSLWLLLATKNQMPHAIQTELTTLYYYYQSFFHHLYLYARYCIKQIFPIRASISIQCVERNAIVMVEIQDNFSHSWQSNKRVCYWKRPFFYFIRLNECKIKEWSSFNERNPLKIAYSGHNQRVPNCWMLWKAPSTSKYQLNLLIIAEKGV